MSEVDARFVNTAIYVEPPVEDENFKNKEYFLPINNFACGDSNSNDQHELEIFDFKSNNHDKEIYKRVSTSISDYSFLKKERRCKLETKTNVLNKPSGNDCLYNKSPNNETYRQKTTRISKSCSEIFQKSVDLSVKRANSEHRQNNQVQRKCETKRIKSKTDIQEKKEVKNNDRLAEAKKDLEKEKSEKENFLKWLQQKKLERLEIQKKASEKELELRKALDEWNEVFNPVKKLAVLQWHIQKNYHQKEKKAQIERLKMLNERKESLKLQKLEESSKAFEKWVEKSKSIPKPTTQGLLQSGHRLDSGSSPFWRIQLDQDLLETISAIYPEWFKDYTNTRASTSSNQGSSYSQSNIEDTTTLTGDVTAVLEQGHKTFRNEPKQSSNIKKKEEGFKERKEKRALKDTGRVFSEGIIDGGKKGLINQSERETIPDTATIRAAFVSVPESDSKMAEGNQSSPKAEVDDTPLQQAMDRNKESLKVKLMLRRPINQLVAQGIMPPLKTPPAFHEQRKQLERAKTGDLLKAKIQQRPGRDELVRQHILEDVGHVDPSLAERQRMLKKARLADQLNDQLSHRPGPLELIQKNILHTEEPIERAVKEGHIPFKATCEGQLTKPQHPDHYINFEDDSQSSEGAPSPPVESTQTDVLETVAASAGIVTVSLSVPTTEGAVVVTSSSPVFQQASSEPRIKTYADLCNSIVGNQQQSQPENHQQNQLTQHHVSAQQNQSNCAPVAATLLPLAPAPSPMSLGSTTSSLSPLSNISIASPPAPPPAAITPRPQPSPITSACQRSDAPGKDKNRKKSKTKNQPKTRTIKFHEYKGPPNAQKTTSSGSSLGSSASSETSYDLLLHQQQILLQWQLQSQYKFPQMILPASQKPLSLSNNNGSDSSSLNVPSPASSNSSNNLSEQPPLRPLGKLEDMKVSDLKVELKRRNLPVSGSKPQLIERLKPFTESSSSNPSNSNGPHVTQMGHILMDTPGPLTTDESNSQAKSPALMVKDEPHSPRMDSPHSSEHEDPASPPSDDIIKEQQKRIEELQRELYKSKQQLQQIRQTQPATVRAEKLVLQQHIQNKMQQQQLALHLQQLQQLQAQQQQSQQSTNAQQQQQQQHTNLQQINAKANLAAFLQTHPNNAATTTTLDSATLTAINNKKNQNKSNSTVQLPAAIVLNLARTTKLNGSILGALVAQAQQTHQQPTEDVKPSPPPQYDEAAKLLKVKIGPVQKSQFKSQVVDDVLEILIKNGELPPSAAQDPATPTTPNRQLQQNLVFTTSADSPSQSLVFAATSPISPISPISPVSPISPLAMDVSQSTCPSPSPPAPPPPPPPLPLATFSVQLPSALQRQQQQQAQHSDISSFSTDLLSSEAEIETPMLLSPQQTHQSSPDPQPPQEVTSSDNTNLDLKELGLDLETLDTMDFGQLDCDLEVKMEAPQELMDIGDMPMDMDDSDWLDSLMPQSPPNTSLAPNHHQNHQPTLPQSQSTSNDLYDPLLSNSQDPFDLFNIEDSDFKMTSDLTLTWDKVDFAT